MHILVNYINTVAKSKSSWKCVSQPSCNSTRSQTVRDLVTAAGAEALQELLCISNGEDSSPLEALKVENWLRFANTCFLPDKFQENVYGTLSLLNKSLAHVTFLVSDRLTAADLVVFAGLAGVSPQPDLTKFVNITRWYSFISSQPGLSSGEAASVAKPAAKQANKAKPAEKAKTPAEKKPAANADKKPAKKAGAGGVSAQGGKFEEGGKFADLPGAEMGKVVVRFPPEASGYLHIGHAKAALLNQHYRNIFNGHLIMRFDDTNPAKETDEFERVILEDLALLNVKYDSFSRTSDHFEAIEKLCTRMIEKGHAYCDNTPAEEMKAEREERKESRCRNFSVKENLSIWNDMRKGTPEGQKYAVRVKMDMSSDNGCLRDPTIYRCKAEPHLRTGTRFKVYPTYDFACPVVDSLEGVTHALRTTEYHDRDAQYAWLLDLLEMEHKPRVRDYSRLALQHTVLSKRKLAWLVSEGWVEGWDDPRLATVRGIRRRGMTAEALGQFIQAQGSSRSSATMEWDKLWTFNKKVIDPIAPRYTGLLSDQLVAVRVVGSQQKMGDVNLHPKTVEVGTKQVCFGTEIWVERADVDGFKEGENVTFINWGNLRVKKVHKSGDQVTGADMELNLEDRDYKKTAKVTWLAADKGTEEWRSIPLVCRFFSHIISKPIVTKDEDFKQYLARDNLRTEALRGEFALKNVKKGDIIQLQRRGFFICDQEYCAKSPYSEQETPCLLIYIPDGHSKELPQGGQKGQTPASTVPKSGAAPAAASGGDALAMHADIKAQGDRIRDLKVAKTAKAALQPEVDKLLNLKKEYKALTGQDWKPDVLPPAGAKAPTVKIGVSAADLHAQIKAQGDKIRDLKTAKADKASVQPEVEKLLELKKNYKAATGLDWKPEPPSPKKGVTSPPMSPTVNAVTLHAKVKLQGDKIRDLKAAKADKAALQPEVAKLLALKKEYKAWFGQEWSPDVLPSASSRSRPTSFSVDSVAVSDQIKLQGDKIRDLKTAKADKATLQPEIAKLLELKKEFKVLTGVDWKPDAAPPAAAAPTGGSGGAAVSDQIKIQGDKIRDLKTAKADKATLQPEIAKLLELKKEFKSVTGQDWKPDSAPAPSTAVAAPAGGGAGDAINEQIKAQGDRIRTLKSAKTEKSVLQPEIEKLLSLKSEFKKVTGKDWKP